MTISKHTFSLRDGRASVCDTSGSLNAPTVVLFQAAPGSRRFDPDPVATAQAGIRMVTIDRAGYGASDPIADGVIPTIPGYAADTAVVLDQLGVTDAVLVGWSAGGRVAAALAASRPELAATLCIVATPAPDDEVPWVPDEQRPAIDAMRADPAGAVEQLAAMLGPTSADPAARLSLIATGEAEESRLAVDGDLRRRLDTMLAEGFAQGSVGLAADIVSYTVADWGFDPTAIGVPSTCVYGSADTIVPPHHGDWWAERIPDAEIITVPDAGHLVITDAWRRLLRAIDEPSDG